MRTPRVERACSICPNRSIHTTTRDAQAACQRHEIETDHELQQISTIYGWTYWKPRIYRLSDGVNPHYE